jgi:hypothetical protein
LCQSGQVLAPTKEKMQIKSTDLYRGPLWAGPAAYSSTIRTGKIPHEGDFRTS